VPVTTGAEDLVTAVQALGAAGITVDDIALRRPTLDDVFLSLTGHAAEMAIEESEEPEPESEKRRRRRDR
jgi:ABC-2 type transport system ATP-binding protein